MPGEQPVAKAMDVTARTLDLLAVLTKVAQTTEVGSLVMKEIGKWLGKEGLDENELQFFLESTRGLMKPNTQSQVTNFFKAVTSRLPHATVVPLWAQPSGALGRLVSRDPHQRWITSTISCLFRYHDERFIKFVLCGLIMQSIRKDKAPLSEYQLAWHPDNIRLSEVVNKVINSNWISIANAGLIGSESECPHLPEELKWACEKGHNIESYKLALIMSKLLDPPVELIIQSEHLLTNLVLWLLWHFNGELRIVVSGYLEYSKVLGPEKHKIECRVAKKCDSSENGRGRCSSKEMVPIFEMYENVAGSLKKVFGGKYDSQQTLSSESRARQKLYNSPFQYPKGSNSIKIQTLRTAQELLRWYVERPVVERALTSKLDFHIRVLSYPSESSPALRIGDLLGRTPALLTMQCGELGRTFVVFSPPPDTTPPTVDNFMDMDESEVDGSEEEDVAFESRPEVLLKYFPILQDLVDQVGNSCRCFRCHRNGSTSSFQFDQNCLQYKAFMEVMFYFGHGIADAFGAPDSSSCSETLCGDSGATAVLLEAIDGIRMGYDHFQGILSWNTLLSTSIQIFLGCPPLGDLTDATENDASVDTSPHYTQHLSASVIAVQHGDLGVVAPWLDITQSISCVRSFRFDVVQGRLCLPINENLEEQVPILQELARDTAVIETQHSEDVSDYAARNKIKPHPPGSTLQIPEDGSKSFCDFVLVSVDQTRYKLLMRVSSSSHSRMVDPSAAMLKVAGQVFPVKCVHQKKSHQIATTGQYPSELYSFEQLLGRWGDTTKRETVSTENSPATSESEATSQKPPRTKKQIPLIVSYSLPTFFKYNVALALTGDNPVFVNRGDACLPCHLQQAADFTSTDIRPSYARWVITCPRSLGRYVPQSAYRLESVKEVTSRKRVKRRLEGNVSIARHEEE